MRGIKFVDTNQELTDLMHQAIRGIDNVFIYNTNIFRYDGVLVSASNPSFTFGGGLDAQILKRYPETCIKVVKGKNQRIGNIIFTITVDRNLKSSKKLITAALTYAKKHVKKDEYLLLSGLGTGIGGLSPEEFVQCFLEVFGKIK